jgi:hypothetical protein
LPDIKGVPRDEPGLQTEYRNKFVWKGRWDHSVA